MIAVIREKKNENIMDFFFAGRSLPFWALSITFIASWWGAGSALSTVDLAYEDGIGAFWYYGMPVLVSTFIMILLAEIIRGLPFLTQGEIMHARYSKTVAKAVSFLIFLFMTFTASSQMVGVGDFFGQYLDLSYEAAVLLGTGIVIIYSMFGGFRGVVFTDIIQFILLLASALIVFIAAYKLSGGYTKIEEYALSIGKTGYTSFGSGLKKYASYVITFAFAWSIQANVWQRISAAKSKKDARKMTILSFIVYIPLYLMVVLTGMAALTFYKEKPEGGVVIGIVKDFLPQTFAVFVFVGISAAIMSTMDSLINTAAMTLTMDIMEKKDENAVNQSRISTAIVSLIALIVALKIRSILDISKIASDIITTGVFVPLIFGMFWRRGNTNGAISSIIAGFLYTMLNFSVSMGLNLKLPWKNDSTEEILIGIAISVTVFILVSLFTKPEYDKADRFIKRTGVRRKLFK